MSQPERSGFAEHAEDVKHFPLEDRAQAPVPQGPIFLPAFGTQEGVLAERRLLRKLDFRLMPAIVAIFILNNIDRTGITAARRKGFEEDLGRSGLQYNIILSIFYVVYSPTQIPSNMILNKIR